MKKVIRFFKQIKNIFTKQKRWTKIAIVLGIILIILMFVNKHIQHKEAFTQREKYVLKQGDQIYDNFYSTIYDELVYDDVKNDFEVGELKRLVKPTKHNRILDIGSGNGHHVALLNKNGYKAEGLDKSEAMIKNAKKKISSTQF